MKRGKKAKSINRAVIRNNSASLPTGADAEDLEWAKFSAAQLSRQFVPGDAIYERDNDARGKRRQ
jgi:hypothetical protein